MTEATTIKQRLKEALQESIDRSQLDRLVADIYESLKAISEATEYYNDLTERAEKASEQDARDLHERAGVIAFAIGRYRDAVKHLESVKTRKEAAYYLGRACAEVGRLDEALTALATARKGDDDFETDMLVADVQCQRREPEAARKLCEHYAKGKGSDPDWLYTMGRVLETEGEYEQAMADYEKALQKNPDHRKSLFRLALNCDLNGEDERALEIYQKCASFKPTFVSALVNLGVMYEDRGDYTRAARCYKQILSAEPNHARARLYLKDAEASLTMVVTEERKQLTRPRSELLDMPLAGLELSARSRTVIEKLNIKTLGELAEITQEHLMEFKNFGETSLEEIKELLTRHGLGLASSKEEATPGMLEPEDEETREKYAMSVELMGLSTRSRKCMERLNITTVGQLIQHTEDELLSTPNFGRTSVQEIRNTLAEMGLALREE